MALAGWKSCTVLLCNIIPCLCKLRWPVRASAVKKKLVWIVIQLLAVYWHHARAYSPWPTKGRAHPPIRTRCSYWFEVFFMVWDGLLAPAHISHLAESSYLIGGGKNARWDITEVDTETAVRTERVLVPHVNEMPEWQQYFHCQLLLLLTIKKNEGFSGRKEQGQFKKKWISVPKGTECMEKKTEIQKN